MYYIYAVRKYSETCLKDHLCNKTTSILRPQFSIILYMILYRHSLIRPQILVPRVVLLSRFHCTNNYLQQDCVMHNNLMIIVKLLQF